MAVLFFFFFAGGDTVIPKSDFTIAFMGVRRSRQIITFHEVKEQDSAVDMYGLWLHDVCRDNDSGFTATQINLWVHDRRQRIFI